MKILLIALLFLVTPAYAKDRSYAEKEDACLKSLLSEHGNTPGGSTGLFTTGQVDGFFYTIDIRRKPEWDEDKATLKEEEKRLKNRLKEIQKQMDGQP